MEFLRVQLVFLVVAYARAELQMEASNFRMCANKTYTYNLNNVILRERDNAQEVKLKIVMNKELSNDNNFLIMVDRFIGNKEKRILNIKNKGACGALIQYGGEALVGAVRQAKFPHPDTCPLEKGVFTLDWYKIDFKAIPLVSLVPKGKFRLTVQILDPKTGTELICITLTIAKN